MKKNYLVIISFILVFAYGCSNASTSGSEGESANQGKVQQEENKNKTESSNDIENISEEKVKSVFEKVPEGFRVMTVGSGSPKFDIHRGGSSTLIQYKEKYFLVDSGPKTTYTLLENGLSTEKIKNMLFTHQHVDHNGDFWNFFIGGWGSATGRRSLNLIGPGVQELYDVTVDFFRTDIEYRSSIGFPTDGILSNVHIKNFTEDEYSFELDGVKIKAIPVPHSIETYAYRFEADGKSIVVSGDLTYTDVMGPFAKDADILVIDAMLISDFSDLPEVAREGMKNSLMKSHISSEEIAQVAADSGVKKLVLTHLGGGEVDMENIKSQYAKEGFKGEIILAEDGLIINP
ncbi:hypothetical protein CJ195_05070 [Bacillus sp. UMB0899]|nr:hypothetical protein CJ195_05070 [Bacillus sp. UMB0899]